jgi:hypothetical protein
VLDCAWASGANCWKSTVAAAEACLPPNDPNAPPGMLSSDQATCTYASGQTIAFARTPFQQGHLLLPSFDLTKGGMPCLKFDELSNGEALTTAAGTVTITLDASQTTVTLACPDGSAFSGPLASLASCENATPGLGEGEGGFVNDAGSFSGNFGVDLGGTEGGGSTLVFACATP